MDSIDVSAFPAPHIIEPTPPYPHTHTIIILHGRGSNGPDFASELFDEESSSGLNLRQQFPGLKWVFPTARKQYSPVFQEEMTEWFDIYSLMDPSKNEETQVEGLRCATNLVLRLIRSELELINGPGRLLLAGISQGCAIGIHALLASSLRLGAFIGWSGWMPFRSQIEDLFSSAAEQDLRAPLAQFYQSFLNLQPYEPAMASSAEQWLNIPIILCHGSDDNVVDVRLGREMRYTLEKLRINVSWKEYNNCGHWIKELIGVDDIVSFLRKHVQTI